MKSSIASLREITLPFGATTGGRIVLDGINGEIRIYNSAGALVIRMDSDEFFQVLDSNGNIRVQMGILAGLYSLIGFSTGELNQTSGGLVSLVSTGATGRNRMVIAPGDRGNAGTLEWTILSAPSNDTSPSMLQVVGLTLDSLLTHSPIIDLTGASTPTNLRPYTVVYDLSYGTPNGYGQAPNFIRSYGRGAVAYGEQVNNVTLDTTAGNFTTVVTTGAADVYAGRRYAMRFSGGQDLLTNGSGFTVADTWGIKFQRSVNAGASWGDVWGRAWIARSWVASGFRYNIPPFFAYYTPATNANVMWRLQASKLAGAATVNSILETDAGAAPMQLSIEDIGEAI